MNLSVDGNVTHISLKVRDTFVTALTKNIIVVALWISINYINGTFVHTFFKHEIFNVNPRYILFIHLVINDMIQLTIAVFLHVISYILFTINVSLCSFLLMIAIFTTLNTPVNLATMALERYIAICIPLRHSQICTVHRTYILIGIIWIMAAIPILPDLFILLATEPLQFFHSKIFCSRDSLFRNPYLIEKKNISHAVYLTVVWFTLFYTYFRIMFTAKAANADAKKARNTILLHAVQLLMCMFTYIGPLIDSLLLYIFSTHALEIQFTSYVIVHILPRFISPIVYGLRDQTFRKYLKRYLICRVNEHLSSKCVPFKHHQPNEKVFIDHIAG
ncbi:odorant receptor 131-2-like [Salvelinus alpinus]